MKKIKKIFLIILILLLTPVIVLSVWQRENIKALYNSRIYTSEEIRKKIDDSKKELAYELSSKYNLKIQDLSAEDELKLMKGAITYDDVIKKYSLAKVDVANNKSSSSITSIANKKNKNNESKNTSKSNEITNNEDEIIGNHIGQMYSIKAKYLSMLGTLENKAIEEYKASTSESKKKDIGYKYASIAGEYEGDCDFEVENILSSLNSQLLSINADTSIVSKLREAYYEEKQAKKSYYLSQF